MLVARTGLDGGVNGRVIQRAPLLATLVALFSSPHCSLELRTMLVARTGLDGSVNGRAIQKAPLFSTMFS